jgi:hypothetical protein
MKLHIIITHYKPDSFKVECAKRTDQDGNAPGLNKEAFCP